MKKSRVAFALLSLVSVLGASALPAQAAPGDSIALYFSAPFVKGTHVEDAITETFNGYADGSPVGSTVACPTSIPGFATVTYTPGNCTIGINADQSPASGEPIVGGSHSSFVSKTVDTTFTFTNPVKYVGFWWMMGSNGNSVEFLDAAGASVATLNVNDVVSFLGSNSLVTNADTRTVNTVEGGTHLKKRFYRSPTSYTGSVSAPVMDYDTLTYANEPWIYLNLFVSGNVSVSKVRFYGANFEMDNLSVSTTESGPRGDMVLMNSILGTPPVAQVISWNPTNTTVLSDSPSLTPNVSASLSTPLSGGGAITYQIVDAGTSGCTVNASTGVITYTAIGLCVVKATAAAVPGTYFTATKQVTFDFQTAPSSPPVDNEDSESLAATGGTVSVYLLVMASLLLLGGFTLSVVSRRINR